MVEGQLLLVSHLNARSSDYFQNATYVCYFIVLSKRKKILIWPSGAKHGCAVGLGSILVS